MKLHNFRLGFANNSSSSHSFILLPDAARHDTGDSPDFGWRHFTASSEASKRDYVAIILAESLRGLAPARLIAGFVNEACGTSLDPNEDADYSWGPFAEAQIDHQSLITLPTTFAGDDVHPEFFREFLAWVLRPDVAILGGNDNDYPHDRHPLGPGRALILPYEERSSEWAARRDTGGGQDFWTLFNRQTGAKIRLSFLDPTDEYTPQWSMRPELVDVKITDRCPLEKRCGWCYQGSTVDGPEADEYRLGEVARALAELEVFEVAIGGGEPTLHPQFVWFLLELRQAKVVPNFTTQNLAWLRDRYTRERVVELCGSFAFSANSSRAAELAIRAARKVEYPLHRMQIQAIPALMSDYEVARLLEVCRWHNVRLTLLGYKETGRGAAFAPPSTDAAWVPVYLARRDAGQGNPAISVDTAMARRLDLPALGVRREFYHTEEGRWSMYVDAVAGKAGPSSFCADDQYRPLDFGVKWKRLPGLSVARQIERAFGSWRPTA